MLRKGIRELVLGMPEEEVDQAKLEELVESMDKETQEVLVSSASDANKRTLKEILDHPEKFSWRFSLTPLVPEKTVGKKEFSVTVSLTVIKSSSKNYRLLGFRLELKSLYYGEFRILRGGRSPNGNELTLTSLIDEILERVNPQKPDLVLAYLFQGIQKAYREIQYDIYMKMERSYSKEDASRLFKIVLNDLSLEDSTATRINDLEEDLEAGLGRVEVLEEGITDAVKRLEDTKSISGSLIFKGIREDLEALLNKDNPKEEEVVGGFKSISH